MAPSLASPSSINLFFSLLDFLLFYIYLNHTILVDAT